MAIFVHLKLPERDIFRNALKRIHNNPRVNGVVILQLRAFG